MFYERWMSYLKDEAKITKIAVPGAHNAGTKGMLFPARCQNGTIYEQFQYGVREFGIRISTDRKGVPYICHGLLKGMRAEEAFAYMGQTLRGSGEFCIFDIRTYTEQKFGPLSLSYGSNDAEISRLIEKYLDPARYALTDFDDINDITLGDLRRSGKKYIILHPQKAYDYSCDCELLEPWDAQIFGSRPEKFAKACVDYLRTLESSGFFWLQTQQTPNPGTEIGMTWSNKLEKMDRPFFPQIMAEIAADPALTEKVNIVAGDFMTADHMKVNEILYFNLLKGIVRDELREEYAAAIGKPLCS
ncbi:MAG: hypothetical protein IKD72_09520 [Clostridia bacterium]|nr:hypothetical protein [Clostridia bacterium]